MRSTPQHSYTSQTSKQTSNKRSVRFWFKHFFAVVGITAVLFVPSQVHAFAPVVDISALEFALRDAIIDSIVKIGKLAIKNGLRVLLTNIAYDTATWIASGDEKQKPLIFTKEIGQDLKDRGDAVAGEMLNTLAMENGFVKLNLCNLPVLEAIQFKLILPRILGYGPAPSCKFSKIKEGFKAYKDQLAAFTEDPNSLIDFSVSLDNGANPLSALLSASDQVIAKTQEEKEASIIRRSNSAFKDKEANVSGAIQTPASIIEGQLQATIEDLDKADTILTGDIVADTVSVFFSTLASKMLERYQSGFLEFATETDISESLAGGSSTVGGAGGVQGAQETFASLRKPSFTTGGEIDVLAQLASCPDQITDLNNCVISENFRLAIEQGFTVNQAIEQGIIDPASVIIGGVPNEIVIDDPNEGLTLRALKILKYYNIVPVGWVLAGQYNHDYGISSLSLKQAIEAFEQCAPDNYSPYCGLIDGDWVLKAPEAFCRVQGYGEVVANEDAPQFNDTDGNPYTPEEQLVTRVQSCLDTQTCLSEDDEGHCSAFGYCTVQEDLYRFQGESCPSTMASCEVFSTQSNEQVAYLKNTLNYDDCTADNAECQWYCSVTDTQGNFACVDQDTVYQTCTSSSGCSCSISGDFVCTVTQGNFSCADDNGTTCTMPTQENDDATLTFDRDVEACAENDAGCTEFIPVTSNNILFNGSFEHFNTFTEATADALDALSGVNDPVSPAEGTGQYDDTFGFFGEAGSGAPCSASTDGQTCYGWEFQNTATARAVSSSVYGSVGLQLASAKTDNSSISSTTDTGQPLENRTFSYTFSYLNPSETACSGQYWIQAQGVAPLTKHSITYEPATSFASAPSEVFTFPEGVTTTAIQLFITQPIGGCSIAIDGATLAESSALASYTDYGSDRLYLNTNKTSQCAVEEIGCELYSPVTGESDIAVPGKITNPLSSVCGGGEDFTNPSCSQCLSDKVGCDAYIETPTPYSAPINDRAAYDAENAATSGTSTTASEQAQEAIAQRTGLYCEGTGDSCSTSADCASGVACVPSVSVIPETATTCSAANIGCEEYVNLEAQGAGGEVLEYYTYIRQCVKPTEENADERAYYYTFEGSDVSGYQIRSWHLKKSNLTSSNKTAGTAPCTSLDVYGASAQTADADCVDTAETQKLYSCSADEVGANPDCTAFYDAEGRVFHVLKSATISVDENCKGIRNSLDGLVYYTLPQESISCPASANLCREYKGSQGGNVEVILSEDFDTGAWEGGQTSSDVIAANNGQSMAIGTATQTGSTQAKITVGDKIEANDSYIVSFWAKRDSTDSGSNARITPSFYSPAANVNKPWDSVEIDTEWQSYTVGPFLFAADAPPELTEEFRLTYTGSFVVVDNLELQKNNSHYLIKNTAELCHGYEGCEEYRERNGTPQYLKSFVSLCEEDAVGCTALIQTENSDLPYYQEFNTGNEYDIDDVSVAVDSPAAYIVRDDAQCGAAFAGCELLGLPDLNSDGTVESYEGQTLINDPDVYSTTLCQEQQRDCQVYKAANATEMYFKDPGDKLCTYNSGTGRWEKPDGSECPIQNPNDEPSQPLGPVCNGGERANEMCQTDSDCPAAEGDATIYRCTSEAEDSGWVGACEEQYSGCTLYYDPNTKSLVENDSFEIDVQDNSTQATGSGDGIPDSWFTNENSSDGASENNFIDGNSTGCADVSSETKSGAVFDGKTSLKLQTSPSPTHCIVFSEAIEVDPNSVYTLSGHINAEKNSPFALGLLYYDVTGVELEAGEDANDDYAIAAYDGGSRSDDEILLEWTRYQGSIGPNLMHRFPAGTAFVKVFIEALGTSSATLEEITSYILYADAVQFSKQKEYTYLSSTVDGAVGGDQNTCNGTVDIGNGCVAFRDSTNDSLAYLASIEAEQEGQAKQENEDYALNTCDFGSADPSLACDSRPNTADANSVLKVKQDRECSQWLACSTAAIELDSSGNVANTICQEVRTCTERNEDTGVCMEFSSKVPADELGYTSDMSVVSSPDNTVQLDSISHNTGYSYVGIEWQADRNASGEPAGCSSEGKCVGGALHGQSCETSDTCVDAVYQGSYPVDWMPERGLGGASSFDDLVKKGDFEAVYCDAYQTSNAELTQVRDLRALCTVDSHCRSTETDQKAAELGETGEYYAGWCNNVSDSESWPAGLGTWQKYSVGGSPSTNLDIIDYDARINYDAQDKTTGASATLNLNNVLYVAPQASKPEGVRTSFTNDSNPIIQGQEYTLAFDAQYMKQPGDNDHIQIGFEHEVGSGDFDMFEYGQGIADIVFMIDLTGSMEEEIKRVASGLSTIVDGLQAEDVSYQFAIITKGGGREPHVLDYIDYKDTSAFGAQDGVTRDFSSDPSEVTETLTYLSTHLIGCCEESYNAIKELEKNSFEYRDVVPASGAPNPYSLKFREGSERFGILVTDAKPESEDPHIDLDNPNLWDQADEDAFVPKVKADKYILNVITTDSARQAYDEVAAKLGGTASYNLDSANYDSLLESITEDILEQVQEFAFTTAYEHYVLGPLVVDSKADVDSASVLFFAQTDGSSGAPFVIDNVSLKPALEVNFEGNPHSEKSSWLAGQQCRGYPESESLSCEYSTPSGVRYEGWKGYCLESDPTDPRKCISWWPVDVLSGESASTSKQTPVQYNDNVPAYHCLVAKGNAELGTCSKIPDPVKTDEAGTGIDTGTGANCVSNADCDEANGYYCLGNGRSGYTMDMGHWTYNNATPKWVDQRMETKGYAISHVMAPSSGNKIVLDLDNATEGSQNGEANDKNQNFAWFGKVPATNLHKSVHISEIDQVSFNMGDTYSDVAEAAYNAGGQGYNTLALESDGNDGDGNTLWASGTGTTTPEGGGDYELEFAYQTGVWCPDEGQNCDTTNLDQAELQNIDVIYSKAIAQAFDGTEDDRSAITKLYNGGTPTNIFTSDDFQAAGEDIQENENVWTCHGEMVAPSGDREQWNVVNCNNDENFEDTKDLVFDSAWNSEGTDGSNGGDCGEDGGNADGFCGANIIISKVDFNNGYIDALYFGFWNGLMDYDISEWQNVTWKFFLKEPCLLMVESAGGDTDSPAVVPWQARLREDSGYRVPGLNYTYQIAGPNGTSDAANSLYGNFGTTSPAPDDVDGENAAGSEDGLTYTDFTAVAPFDNVPMINLRTDAKTVTPYSCIGKCNAIRCENKVEYDSGFTYNATNQSSGSCVNNEWIGFAGVCSGVDATTQQAVLCDDNTDCVNAGNTCLGMSDSSARTSEISNHVAALFTPVSQSGIDIAQTFQIAGDDDPDHDESSCANYTTEKEKRECTNCADDTTPSEKCCKYFADLCPSDTGGSSGGSQGSESDFSDSTTGPAGILSFGGTGKGYRKYKDQLIASAKEAWTEHFRYLFADVQSHIYWVPPHADSEYKPDIFNGLVETQKSNFATVFSSDSDTESDYYEMGICDSADQKGTDYCGVLPTVTDIRVNGNIDRDVELNNNATATISFDSFVDPDQEPLKRIKIVYEGTEGEAFNDENPIPLPWEAAAIDNHTYTHVYSCDPTSGDVEYIPNYNDTGVGACVYQLKIRIEDNWQFCSGTGSDKRNGNGSACTSSDVYTGTIYVKNN